MQVRKKKHSLISYALANLIFANRILARHHLGLGSTLAGHLDELVPERISGWIFDKRGRSDVLKLGIFINGHLVVDVEAGDIRTDLAKITKSDGRCGFAVNLPYHQWTPDDLVTIRVLNRRDRVLYHGQMVDSYEVIRRAISHLVAHVTAAHEEGLRRHDVTRALLERILNNVSVSTTTYAHKAQPRVSTTSVFGPRFDMDQSAIADFLTEFTC